MTIDEFYEKKKTVNHPIFLFFPPLFTNLQLKITKNTPKIYQNHTHTNVYWC